MGLWDTFNEINPLAQSNSERAAEAARHQPPAAPMTQSSGLPAPWQAPSQSSTVGPPGGGSGTDPKIAGWAALFGIPETAAGMVFRDESGSDTQIGAYLQRLHEAKPQDVEGLQRQLYRAGFFGSAKPEDILWGQVDDKTLSGAADAAMRAARYYTNSNTTLGDVLDHTLTGQGTDPSDPSGNVSRSVSTVNLSSAGDAGAALRQAMTSLLGRAPRAKEVRRFHRALNKAEWANPTVQTEQTTEDPDTGHLTSQQSSTGGISSPDVATLAEQNVLGANGEERNRYGVMSYMQAFEQAIGG